MKKLSLFIFLVFACITGSGCMQEMNNPNDPMGTSFCDKLLAMAGKNRIITDAQTSETSVTLDGSASIGNIILYEWSYNNTVIGTGSIITYSFPVGINFVTLTVTDSCGLSSNDTIAVVINTTNVQPAANAGDNITITDAQTSETSVTLDGSASAGNIILYEWNCNNTVIGTGSIITHSFPVGINFVTLTVTDSSGLISNDTILIEIKSAKVRPVADAGGNNSLLITGVSSVSLDGSGSISSPGHTLNYLWTSINGGTFISGKTSVKPVVTLPPDPGVYYFTLVVDDGVMFSEPSVVALTVVEPDAYVDSALAADNPAESRYKTIQDAIDALSPVLSGEKKIIAIQNGPFPEKITLNSNLHLLGIPTQTVSTPEISISLDEGEAVVDMYDNTTIEKLKITCSPGGSGEDTFKTAVKFSGKSITVQDCVISDTYSDGIYLLANSSGKISRSLLENITGEGIEIYDKSIIEIINTRIFNTNGSGVASYRCDKITINNCILYDTGYHGIDFINCADGTVEHTSIIDFNKSGNNPEINRHAINIIDGGSFHIKNNLIVIKDFFFLSGIYSSTKEYSGLDYHFNYIYSRQTTPVYYSGLISIQNVDPDNYPNKNITATEDPLFVDPAHKKFSLNNASPAKGLGENNTDPGALD